MQQCLQSDWGCSCIPSPNESLPFKAASSSSSRLSVFNTHLFVVYVLAECLVFAADESYGPNLFLLLLFITAKTDLVAIKSPDSYQ